MSKVFSLVNTGRETFIMLNAKHELKNNQCNSTIFVNKESTSLNTNVFHYFDLKVNILINNLDRRTKKFKSLEKQYQYFGASYLPIIKIRANSNSFSPYKF